MTIDSDELFRIDPRSVDLNNKDGVRSLLIALYSALENILQENQRLREENQKLKDEIALLKGEKGAPVIKPSVPSSFPKPENEKPRKWKKSSKKDKIRVDRQVRVPIEEPLPSDAIVETTRKVIIQDIKIITDNVEYLLPVYYSKSKDKYYYTKLPKEVRGSQFGPNLKTLICCLAYRCRVPENKIHEFLVGTGVVISKGQVSNIMIKEKSGKLSQIKKEIIEVALKISKYLQGDDTGARHKGENSYMHIICNDLFSAFFIRKHKNNSEVRANLNLKDGELLKIPFMSDGAGQFNNISEYHARCWIHAIRDIVKLDFNTEYHRNIHKECLETVMNYYDVLKMYKSYPSASLIEPIRTRFEEIFGKPTGSLQIDIVFKSIYKRRSEFLRIIDFPIIPLHNNASELATREGVLRRKICYGTRSEEGRVAWENMLTIIDTCRKLKIDFIDFLFCLYSGIDKYNFNEIIKSKSC